MPKKVTKKPESYIEGLNMNRLRGRMLRLPPSKRHNREILFIYDQLSTLESVYPIVEILNKYGGVTVPDLPGFGGMQSFYRINEKPTIDNLADYLAAFIKLFYKRRRLTIVGMGLGFAIASRTLQKHPSLAKKVDFIVSWNGFSRYDDFKVSNYRRYMDIIRASILSLRLPSVLGQRSFSKRYHKKHNGPILKLDLRTHIYSDLIKTTLDICSQQIDLPLYNITDSADLNKHITEQHLKVIYRSVKKLPKPKSQTHKKPKAIIPGELMHFFNQNK